MERITKYEPQN